MPVQNPRIADNVVGQINSTATQPTITWGGDVEDSSGTGLHGSLTSVSVDVSGVAVATFNSSGMRTTGSLGVGNSAAATTPGTVVKKIEIFDANGVSLGFIAVYDAIV